MSSLKETDVESDTKRYQSTKEIERKEYNQPRCLKTSTKRLLDCHWRHSSKLSISLLIYNEKEERKHVPKSQQACLQRL